MIRTETMVPNEDKPRKVHGMPHPAEYTKITYTTKQRRTRNKAERQNKKMGRNQ